MDRLWMFLFLLTPFAVNASNYNIGEGVTIASISTWESSDSKGLYFMRSDDVWCYIPSGDGNVNSRSLILTLYATGKKADIYCYTDTKLLSNGLPASHKLHQIIAK
ncbi:hypothetical protein [Vibrio hippocampi]|uniref:Uncharacterized protein n=1 Tax=Vibrio hippocampi TaxID=654686 RepID=A0ABM8ZFA4_9VIBR|nr:hypothetical protein [Vibrio hippocampi]CAH0524615.1 hypothetical protein VHP8226_00463 [Vibrio hippocampi]